MNKSTVEVAINSGDEETDMFELYMLSVQAFKEEAKKVQSDWCPKCIHYKRDYCKRGGEPYKVCHRCARDKYQQPDDHPDMFKLK